MGAWGYQPKDNDGSGDLFDEVTSAGAAAVDKIYRKKVKYPSDLWERLGVLQLTIEQMPGVVDRLQDVLKVAVRNDIPTLLASAEWLSEWNDPSGARRSLQAFEKKLEAILAKM